ncbi:MAG: GspH/FimT family pseudopilin [Thermosynechococcaceae cyanobacterium]
MNSYRAYSQQGFSLAEVSVTVLIVGVLAAIAAPTIRFGINPLKDTTTRIESNLKLLRSKAISQTSAYRIRATPSGSDVALTVERATFCTDTAWSGDPSFAPEDLKLDRGVQITQVTDSTDNTVTANNWSICYNGRGLANKNLVVTLRDAKSGQRLEVFPGGAVDVKAIP